MRAGTPVSPSYARNRTQSMDCNSLPGLNRTAFPGGIETSAPVRGLRPIPVLRGLTLNTPNPRSSMRSPFARERFMLPKTVSTASSALVLVIPVLFTTSLMISSLITDGLPAAESVRLHQVLDAKGDISDCQREVISSVKSTGFWLQARNFVRAKCLLTDACESEPLFFCGTEQVASEQLERVIKIEHQSRESEASLLPGALAFLIHVLDRGLVNHQVGRTVAVDLEAALVVPLNDAADFFAIAEHDDHRRPRLHLFLIIKILGVSLLGRRRLAPTSIAVVSIIAVRSLGAVTPFACGGR